MSPSAGSCEQLVHDCYDHEVCIFVRSYDTWSDALRRQHAILHTCVSLARKRIVCTIPSLIWCFARKHAILHTGVSLVRKRVRTKIKTLLWVWGMIRIDSCVFYFALSHDLWSSLLLCANAYVRTFDLSRSCVHPFALTYSYVLFDRAYFWLVIFMQCIYIRAVQYILSSLKAWRYA